MKCELARLKLSACLDGEIDGGLYSEMTSHLEHCQRCREEMESLAGMDALLKGLPRLVPSPGFTASTVALARELTLDTPGESWLRRAGNAILSASEMFLELLEPQERERTGSLDELNDIPTSFMGYAYFKALGWSR
jgi:anti-sigma factor RsiW